MDLCSNWNDYYDFNISSWLKSESAYYKMYIMVNFAIGHNIWDIRISYDIPMWDEDINQDMQNIDIMIVGPTKHWISFGSHNMFDRPDYERILMRYFADCGWRGLLNRNPLFTPQELLFDVYMYILAYKN